VSEQIRGPSCNAASSERQDGKIKPPASWLPLIRKRPNKYGTTKKLNCLGAYGQRETAAARNLQKEIKRLSRN